MIPSRLAPLAVAVAALLLVACAGQMKKPEQGIYGTFQTYGPPKEKADCTPFKTQLEKDDCRKMNERVIEEPFQATIRVHNLQTLEIQNAQLDAEGSYRVVVTPGEYEVCVEGECSDPMTVRMGRFIPYGQRLPRAAPEADGKPAADPAKREAEAPAP